MTNTQKSLSVEKLKWRRQCFINLVNKATAGFIISNDNAIVFYREVCKTPGVFWCVLIDRRNFFWLVLLWHTLSAAFKAVGLKGLIDVPYFPSRPSFNIVSVDVTASHAHSSLPLFNNKSKSFNKHFHFIAQKRFGPFTCIILCCVSAFSKISLKHVEV